MSGLDLAITAVMLLSILFFGGAAVLALNWGLKNGQFENFERASECIFDPDEPIGEMTDRFPERRPSDPREN